MEEKNLCISCFEPITNPICEWCYLKQIDRWLEHSGVNNKKREAIQLKLREALTPEIETNTNCVLCGDEVKVCSYCFLIRVTKTLKKIKLSEELIQSFLADFNYHNEREDEFMNIIK
jgi:hypothetical protein